MNDLCPAYELLIQWIVCMQMWGGAPPDEAGRHECLTYESIMSVVVCRVSHVNESRPTYK